MQQEDLLNYKTGIDNKNEFRLVAIKRLKIIGILIAYNTVMFTMLDTFHSKTESLRLSLVNHMFTVNLVGFLLGSFFAFIKTTEFNYKRRFLNVSLYIIMIIQILLTVVISIGGILTIVSWTLK